MKSAFRLCASVISVAPQAIFLFDVMEAGTDTMMEQMFDQILTDCRMVLDQFALVNDKNADHFSLCRIWNRLRNGTRGFATTIPCHDCMVERDGRGSSFRK
jgi:hypothetical protein